MSLRPLVLLLLVVCAPFARAQDAPTLDDALLELRAAAASAKSLQRATAESKLIAARAERRALALEEGIATLERAHAAAERDALLAGRIVALSERTLADIETRLDAAAEVVAMLQAAGDPVPDPGPDPGAEPEPDPGAEPGADPGADPPAYADDSVWAELPEWIRDRHALMIDPAVLAMPAQEILVPASTTRDELRDLGADRDAGRVPVFVFADQTREGLGVSDSWNRNVPLSALSSGAAFFVAETEPDRVVVAESRGLPGDHPIAVIAPRVVFDPQRVSQGGDCVGIGSNDYGCDIYFAGVGVAAVGRSAVFAHPNAGQRITMLSSHVFTSREHLAAGAAVKWGFQLYDTTLASQDLSIDLKGIREHSIYEHGHGSGLPALHSRLLNLACGGQVYQGTERQYETDAGTPDLLVFDDCIVTGFAQSVGRAGSAITLAGNSRPCVIRDSLIVDDDTSDTAGAAANGYEGENFGLLAVWVPSSADQSYKHLPDRDGKANRAVLIEGSVLATRNAGRPPINVTEATHFEMRRSAYAVAEGAPRSVVVADRVVTDELMLPDEIPVVGDRLRALIGSRLDDYRQGELEITRSTRDLEEFTVRIRDRALAVADAEGLAVIRQALEAFQAAVVEAGP